MALADRFMASDGQYMRLALGLARRGYGTTSPNPMVGAVLVKNGELIGQGWHRRAGLPHAEIEAFQDAERRGHSVKGATLYVTLEPCSTQGRTPPCTATIIAAGIRRVVVGAIDPNPKHAGRGLVLLRQAGIQITHGVVTDPCERLNEAFNFWIVHRRPLVTVKSAMTLDGKIATQSGESKWITGAPARAYAMRLRRGADAILVGINTVLADNPALTLRSSRAGARSTEARLRRIVLDSGARTPLEARVVSDSLAPLTTIVTSKKAPAARVKALANKVRVMLAPARRGRIDLDWLLDELGAERVTHLLVEGGGEVNSSFLLSRLAHRVAFFYAPRILGGADARKAVAGHGAKGLKDALDLTDLRWRRLANDWLLQARIRQNT